MLEGIRVVEMASIAAGPCAAAMLADWGAEVIKIEPLGGDPVRGVPARLGLAQQAFDADFDLHNRGKRSLAINLGNADSYKIIEGLVAGCDVFITNILQEKQRTRRIDWEHLSRINPKLVHASISGYGPAGADSETPSIDHTAFWARSGLAHLMTPKGSEPAPIRRATGDRAAAMALVAGILAAYIEVQRTGRGKRVETSLLRTGAFLVATDLNTQISRGRVGSNQPRKSNINPLHTFLPTKDGRWIAISAGRLEDLAVLGSPELLEDARFADQAGRRQHAGELVDLLDSISRRHTLAEWCEKLQGAAFRWAPVQNAAEVVADPQVRAAGALVDLPLKTGEGSYASLAMPVGFFKEDGGVDGAPRAQAPGIGEHTDLILADLGYSATAIQQMRHSRVVG